MSLVGKLGLFASGDCVVLCLSNWSKHPCGGVNTTYFLAATSPGGHLNLFGLTSFNKTTEPLWFRRERTPLTQGRLFRSVNSTGK
ncbi:hypothetical protein MUG91_G272n13 [Manis pentadactyla]|nr:hypothetical protein MUG91_G272n13 [Manis pentadactyla]